jgi:hypothetical protein
VYASTGAPNLLGAYVAAAATTPHVHVPALRAMCTRCGRAEIEMCISLIKFDHKRM